MLLPKKRAHCAFVSHYSNTVHHTNCHFIRNNNHKYFSFWAFSICAMQYDLSICEFQYDQHPLLCQHHFIRKLQNSHRRLPKAWHMIEDIYDMIIWNVNRRTNERLCVLLLDKWHTLLVYSVQCTPWAIVHLPLVMFIDRNWTEITANMLLYCVSLLHKSCDEKNKQNHEYKQSILKSFSGRRWLFWRIQIESTKTETQLNLTETNRIKAVWCSVLSVIMGYRRNAMLSIKWADVVANLIDNIDQIFTLNIGIAFNRHNKDRCTKVLQAGKPAAMQFAYSVLCLNEIHEFSSISIWKQLIWQYIKYTVVVVVVVLHSAICDYLMHIMLILLPWLCSTNK